MFLLRGTKGVHTVLRSPYSANIKKEILTLAFQTYFTWSFPIVSGFLTVLIRTFSTLAVLMMRRTLRNKGRFLEDVHDKTLL